MQTAETIRDANVRYHDLAAEHYDSKWGINYGAARPGAGHGKLRKALGHEPRRYARALEIGAGTGYFSLNLLRAGVIGEAVATDISPGMLSKLERSAAELGLSRRDRCVRGRRAALRRRLLRPGLRPRGAPPPARSRAPPSASSGACCARAASWPSAASRRTTATGSPRWPKRGANALAPLWRDPDGRRPAAVERERQRRLERGGHPRATGGRARIHARRALLASRPPASRRSA